MIRILFVEDDQRGVNPYFNTLANMGMECVLARDGDEAVARLQTERFDLLSLDVMFDTGRVIGENVDPRRAGLHLLELIRQSKIRGCSPQLKVLVLTAVVNPLVEEKIKALGVIDYLKKPIAFEKVIKAYQAAVG